MSWKVISTQGEYDRYKKQFGVNVFSIHEPVADPKETAQIENALQQTFQQEYKNNQIRFYKSEMKLSDAGGGLRVFLNGKKLEHKAMVLGNANHIADVIGKALAQEQQG